MKSLTLSVHELVDFLLRTGDIDNRVFNKATMAEGTRIHAYYQSKQGNEYLSEYSLEETFYVDDFAVTLQGRADGIICLEDTAIIDEIKTTIAPLNEFFEDNKEWHLGQAKCYALMFAHEKKFDSVGIKLTYIHQIEDSQMSKKFDFKVSTLEKYVYRLIKEYLDFYKFIYERTQERNKSAQTLKFPYSDFRGGQKKLAKYTFGVADKGGILFAEAPTGIGKTISTLFPAVKSFAGGINEKIFYLTAKNSGRETAYDATNLMLENGLIGSTILITAKDKICFCPGKACNPDECPYAKGYYTKIKDILIRTIKEEKTLSTNKISEIAKHHAICPFEFSLDLSLFTDIIICDYNYFFDPMVYLKRFFETEYRNYVVLVDEAHNLVERGRNMYSASINRGCYKLAKQSVKQLNHKKYENAAKKLTTFFNSFKELDEGNHIIEKLDKATLNAIDSYLLASSDIMKHHSSAVTEEFKEFYFDLNKFYKLYDFFDNTFCLFVNREGKSDATLNLFCLDPREHLKATLDQVRSKVLFSATLSPSEYYIDMIGGEQNDPLLKLPSPFPKDNLHLMIAPTISLRYKNRNATLEKVSKYIKTFVNGKVGNYFVYVPSYEYQEAIYSYLEDGEYDLYTQAKDMTEEERTLFLSMFSDHPQKTTVGLLIVGGAFGEGIDLVSDRLIGVAVVGVGLPKICYERNLIKDYFNKESNIGYDYAYTNPGMNKVMQAVGRVIRSETDKGVALLIDDRYLSGQYQDLYKTQWSNYEVITSLDDLEKELNNFWNNK